MKTVSSVSEMQALAASHIRSGRTIGFVPTMGFLHEGHLSLMRQAREHCDVLVVSVFINRMQFGPSEDFSSYPRDMERDLALCNETQVDVVFCPSHEEMYAEDFSVAIDESALSKGFCGQSRPGHFRGVTTVVAKLFNVVRPDFAVFGQKDAQQVAVIKRMVRDLNFPIRIEVAPIVREADGLAMSSRNTYLSDAERRQALSLSQALREAEAMVQGGETDCAVIRARLLAIVTSHPDTSVEYIEIVSEEDLSPVASVIGPSLIVLAVRVGATRLIDNAIVVHAG